LTIRKTLQLTEGGPTLRGTKTLSRERLLRHQHSREGSRSKLIEEGKQVTIIGGECLLLSGERVRARRLQCVPRRDQGDNRQ